MAGRQVNLKECWILPGAAALGLTHLLMVAVSVPALAAPLSVTDFTALAAQCAPSVPVSLLRGIARTESDFQPWTLHDNTADLSEDPPSLTVAETDAANWIGEGHSVDLGLMQINRANLPALGMTVDEALDPCASLAAGAAVLRAAYGVRPVDAGQQAALLEALSVYNTGTPLRGIMNGYAHTVMENAGTPAALTASATPTDFSAPSNMPPSWDVAATGSYTQTHGAPWLVPLGLSSADQPTSPADESGALSQSRRSP